MFDQRLVGISFIGADGPAVGFRHTGYSVEIVVRQGTLGLRRNDNRPLTLRA